MLLWVKELLEPITASSYCTMDKMSPRSQQSSGHYRHATRYILHIYLTSSVNGRRQGTGRPQWVCRKNEVTYSSSNMGVYYFPNPIKLRSVPFMPALLNYYCFLRVEVEMSYFSPDLVFFLFCGFHVLKLTKRSNVSSVMVRSSCFHVISQPIKQCQS